MARLFNAWMTRVLYSQFTWTLFFLAILAAVI
jgi:hypothetical protein